jgi:hypothetical protein
MIWVIKADPDDLTREILTLLIGLPSLEDADIELVSGEQVIADVERHRGGELFAPQILIDPRLVAYTNYDACKAFHDALPDALVVHFTDMEQMGMHLLRHLKSVSPHCLLSLVSDWRRDLREIVAQMNQREARVGKKTPYPNGPLR